MVTWAQHNGRLMHVQTGPPIRAVFPITNAQTWVTFYPMNMPAWELAPRHAGRLMIELKVTLPWVNR